MGTRRENMHMVMNSAASLIFTRMSLVTIGDGANMAKYLSYLVYFIGSKTGVRVSGDTLEKGSF